MGDTTHDHGIFRHHRSRMLVAFACLAVSACSIFKSYELDQRSDAGPRDASIIGFDGGESRRTVPPVSSTNDGARAGGGKVPGSSVGICAPPVPPTLPGCPEECTGGCEDEGGLCVIDCASEAACAEARIQCPTDRKCQVTCEDCAGADLSCPGPFACAVLCDGEESCKGIRVKCAASRCEVQCEGKQACSGAALVCDTTRCPGGCRSVETNEELDSLECLAACSE